MTLLMDAVGIKLLVVVLEDEDSSNNKLCRLLVLQHLPLTMTMDNSLLINTDTHLQSMCLPEEKLNKAIIRS
jgi:hypothetical protein